MPERTISFGRVLAGASGTYFMLKMKALIVEDEQFTREMLAGLLLSEYDFEEVVQAEDGKDGWKRYTEQSFDFIALDLLLPKIDGFKLAKRILRRGLGQRILAISSECDDYTVRNVSCAGILGFVHKKEMSPAEFRIAFDKVFNGRIYYSSHAQAVLDRMNEDSDSYHRLLTKSELEVFRAVAQHKTDAEIGAARGVSAFTIRRQRLNAMNKLNLKNEPALIHFALDKGIVKKKGGLDWSD